MKAPDRLPYKDCGARVYHATHPWVHTAPWSGTVTVYRCKGVTRKAAAKFMAAWRADDPRKDVVKS